MKRIGSRPQKLNTRNSASKHLYLYLDYDKIGRLKIFFYHEFAILKLKAGKIYFHYEKNIFMLLVMCEYLIKVPNNSAALYFGNFELKYEKCVIR
jgi:hypothetical protein